MNQQILNDNWGDAPGSEKVNQNFEDICNDNIPELIKSTDKIGDIYQSNSYSEILFKNYVVVDYSFENQFEQRNQEESNSLEAALGSPNNKKKKTNTKNRKKKGNGPERNKLARSLIRALLRKKECKIEFECYKRHTNQENLNANKYSQKLLRNYLKYSKTQSIVDFLQQELFIQEFEKQKRIKRENFHYYQTYAKMLLAEL